MFRFKWITVTTWIVILGILGTGAALFATTPSNEISIPGTAAQKTLDRFKELFPDAGAKSGTIVIEAPEGKTIADYRTAILALTKHIGEVDDVTLALSPFDMPGAISQDGKIAYISAQLEDENGQVASETIDEINAVMDDARRSGLTVEAGGDLVNKELGQILGVGEVIGILIALVVLVITLGSLVAAGLPILTALVTVGVSMAGLFAISSLIDLTNTAPVLAVMLGLAVGIDYSLFITNRYRTFVKEGHTLKQSAAKAVATAGNAVLFAAATVVIALASLAVVNIPFMTTMGLAAAATVALAAIIAVTLMPAVFGIVGLKIFGRKERQTIQALHKTHKVHQERLSHSTIWYRIGDTILTYRKSILALSLVVVTILALPALHLNLGLPSDETAAQDSSAYKAYHLLEKGFGVGHNGPLVLIIEGLPKADKQDLTVYTELQKVGKRIADVPGIDSVKLGYVSTDGSMGVIQVTPTTAPTDANTKQLVAYLRDVENQKSLTQVYGATIGVTGTTAIQIDINQKLADALPVYLSVVIGLSLVLLMVAFRSILIPIKATLGFLLSVAAMFGALVAVFQWGWFGIAEAPAPIVSFIPIIAIGILFGLAMDYEFFLVSGMQEAYHNSNKAKASVLRGFALGSRVVVAAGLIMVSVFAGFITNHDSTIQSIGFALAIGIFVDAFIVRMVIVPIVMSYLGKAAWWLPKWLDKRLPKISIEG